MQHTADDDAECQRDENLPGETETGHAHRGLPCVDQVATYRKFALVDANRAVPCADTFATLALSSALPSSHPCICSRPLRSAASRCATASWFRRCVSTHARTAFRRSGTSCILAAARRSEEHTSELQSLMRISYAVFCLN